MLSNLRAALGLSRLVQAMRPTSFVPSSSTAFTDMLTPQLELAGVNSLSTAAPAPLSDLFDSLWLAVPKSKISRSKKRMKHGRYKLKNKTNIIRDRITGEWTLRHRLPMNWKMFARDDGYGPKVPFFERTAIFLEQEESKKSEPEQASAMADDKAKKEE
ncbi:hypothetical protein TrLO_g6416 [Triparma laevis f. longispina]|uniref:Uncharacterized protein n=1 Tax=Triparma laevis f. longispina TaxID=1714387 RepID=A0A9W6ZH27_9STRA|nr:hypothetical protein TrLO_g6416 [Triparma laevis f. longispina]